MTGRTPLVDAKDAIARVERWAFEAEAARVWLQQIEDKLGAAAGALKGNPVARQEFRQDTLDAAECARAVSRAAQALAPVAAYLERIEREAAA